MYCASAVPRPPWPWIKLCSIKWTETRPPWPLWAWGKTRKEPTTQMRMMWTSWAFVILNNGSSNAVNGPGILKIASLCGTQAVLSFLSKNYFMSMLRVNKNFWKLQIAYLCSCSCREIARNVENCIFVWYSDRSVIFESKLIHVYVSREQIYWSYTLIKIIGITEENTLFLGQQWYHPDIATHLDEVRLALNALERSGLAGLHRHLLIYQPEVF